MPQKTPQIKYASLYAARKAKGLTIEALAELAQVSIPTVWRVEQRRWLPVNALVRASYLKALGITEGQVRQARRPARKLRALSTYHGGRHKIQAAR